MNDLPIDLKKCKTKFYNGVGGDYLCRCDNCKLHFYGAKLDRTCPDCEIATADYFIVTETQNGTEPPIAMFLHKEQALEWRNKHYPGFYIDQFTMGIKK